MKVSNLCDINNKRSETMSEKKIQMCVRCDEPTNRCEDDSLFIDDHPGPVCEECYDKIVNVLDGCR